MGILSHSTPEVLTQAFPNRSAVVTTFRFVAFYRKKRLENYPADSETWRTRDSGAYKFVPKYLNNIVMILSFYTPINPGKDLAPEAGSGTIFFTINPIIVIRARDTQSYEQKRVTRTLPKMI
jgi:hypothetical protein